MALEKDKKTSPYAVDASSLYDRFRSERPTYAGTFDNQLTELYDKISTRPAFQYDATRDPLFQGMKDQYVQGGKLAMKDTMGQAAALTGGYGSSYGQQVGQQAYDAYLQNLSDVIPELYSQAYGRYQDEGDRMLQQYALLGQQRDAEYGRYRDELGDWESERAYQTQLEAEEYARRMAEEQTAYARERDRLADERYSDELAYARNRDAISDQRYADELAWNRQKYEDETAYNREQAAGNTAYSRQQQAYANLYALIGATGYNPTDAELAAAGMSREAANALRGEYTRQITPAAATTGGGGSSGGSSGGGGRSSGGGSGSGSRAPDGRDAATVQRELNAMGAGLSVDGIWGLKSQAAWEKYYGGGGGSGGNGAAAGASAGGGTGSGGSGTGSGLTFNSQREFDAWLKQQVADGTITMQEATNLRDDWSRAVVR